MEAIQNELIRSNEMLSTQVWILGGAIIVLLSILGFMARSAWADINTMLKDHEHEISLLKEHKTRTEERHINTSAIVEEIRTKLDLIYDQGK
jgi:hypothetical protein